MNYYELLEVSPNASPEVIRAAYKSLMQRYHPDKNPGDQTVAERASLVVQAYEVLSDAEKRSAYDLRLRGVDLPASGPARPVRPAPARARTQPGSRHAWAFVLIAVIVVGGAVASSMLKKRLSANGGQAPRVATPAALPAAAEAPPAEPGARPDEAPRPAAKPVARDLPRLASNLSVRLRLTDASGASVERMLIIPALGVKVGALDAENAIRHLGNTREQLVQKLQEKLMEARYDALIRPDGEQYLAKLILDTLVEASGMAQPAGAPPGAGAGIVPNAPASSPESTERYGVVEVLLPESFILR